MTEQWVARDIDFNGKIPSDEQRQIEDNTYRRYVLSVVSWQEHLVVENITQRAQKQWLEEDVIDNPTDGDLASVLGWAFPSAYGGVLGYIDYFGAKKFISQSKQLADLYGDRFLPPDLLSDMAASGEKFHSP